MGSKVVLCNFGCWGDITGHIPSDFFEGVDVEFLADFVYGFGLQGAYDIDQGEVVFAAVVDHGKYADDVIVLCAHEDGDAFSFSGDSVGGFPA